MSLLNVIHHAESLQPASFRRCHIWRKQKDERRAELPRDQHNKLSTVVLPPMS